MSSLQQWKTNSCLGFFPLKLGVYLIFMVTFCSLILQNGLLYQLLIFERLSLFFQLIYLMPVIFLVAAMIGIYGLQTGKKEFLIPVLIVIIISIITIIACAVNTIPLHKNAYTIACIMILPYGYFWFVIFSLYLHWS